MSVLLVDAAPRDRILHMAEANQRSRGDYEVGGIDLRGEMARLCSLPVFGGDAGPLAERPPTLKVRRASKRPRRNLGFAVPAEHRISVTSYPGIRAGDALETLLHELVHTALGRHHGGWHGRLFRVTLATAMRQAYGIEGIGARSSAHGAYADAIERHRLSAARLHPGQMAFQTAA